ncbi:MAG TPA: hypothetical protein VGK90_08770 [Rhizomicrobium sp.]
MTIAHSVFVHVIAVIVIVSAVSSVYAKPRFVASPKALDEISRGVEDGLHCALQYIGPSQTTACAFAVARYKAQDGADHLAYNVGLSFEAWRGLDVDWSSDQGLVKSGKVSASDLQQEEAGARTMYELYRSNRDALGTSDAELVSYITKLSPSARAAALARLQFWAKHAR